MIEHMASARFGPGLLSSLLAAAEVMRLPAALLPDHLRAVDCIAEVGATRLDPRTSSLTRCAGSF